MMNDTVREELQHKITTRPAVRAAAATVSAPVPAPAAPANFAPAPPPPAIPVSAVTPVKRVETAGLRAPKTSPTLVDFNPKSTALPDWRIQMQNAVKQRKGANAGGQEITQPAVALSAAGAVALKVEPTPQQVVRPDIGDPRMAAALKRIETSRKTHLEARPVSQKSPTVQPPLQMRPFPFDVVSTGSRAADRPVPHAPAPQPQRSSSMAATAPVMKQMPVPQPTQTEVERPKLVMPAPVKPVKLDTNKLPPIAMPEEPMMLEREPVEKVPSGRIASAPAPEQTGGIQHLRIKTEQIHIDGDEVVEPYEDEIEDLAPFSMRFGSGLFDLIIGLFATGLLLSPFAFSNSNWFTVAALLTACGTLALFMFLYMTICLGFFGKTMGMRLFSLELVDAVENEYPTLNQAAVSSSVFLISLATVGSGFLTIFFNEERRALHDLLSGTILVKEF